MFWESAVEESAEIMMDASFHMQCNSPSAGLGKLGTLNISNPNASASSNSSSTLQDFAAEHMSFYGDDEAGFVETTTQTNWHRTSHHHHHEEQTDLLLPDEGPAQRFQIVRKTKGFQRRQSSTTTTTTTSSQQDARNSNGPTPSRGFRVFNSLSSSCSMESSIEDEDDEYMGLFEMESLEQQLQQEQAQNKSTFDLPSNLNSLISGQIKSALTRTPEMRRPSVRRCLSLNENASPEVMQKSVECTTPFSSRTANSEANGNVSPFSAFCFKRPDPPSVSNSPIQPKRYRGDEKENFVFANVANSSTTTTMTVSQKSNVISNSSSSTTCTTTTRVALRKSMSMNDAEIMTALARSESKDEPDLIGDFSKPFVLPLIEGKHRDLKCITSDTVASLLNGEFDQQVANYVIVDCRYPYEYEGGHIRGAKNLYTQEQIVEEFLTQQKTDQQQQQLDEATAAGSNKRNIIIFHCEFSSERGPRLSRFLRNNDRARNTNSYPTLDYPEIYLLHNGYKEFYETHAELCVPNAYRPMLEPAYSDAYRHFRAKSKSWNGDGLGGATTRLKKSRSRLLL